MDISRILPVDEPFSLAATGAPVAWGRGRWPNSDWRGGQLIWVGWENTRLVSRFARQLTESQNGIAITGTASPALDAAWATAVLGTAASPPDSIDPVIDEIKVHLPGLRPWANGSLYDGMIGAIVGQSISVAAAAVTEARLAALFNDGVEIDGRTFWPLPRVDQLASADPALVRTSGVTWRRAEALVAAARAFSDGTLPTDDDARADPVRAREALRALPLVGVWTAESILLWGLGVENAYPPKDVALLRAARRAYGNPDLDHPGLNALAETWSPYRAWAARWIWTDLFGTAPMPEQLPD